MGEVVKHPAVVSISELARAIYQLEAEKMGLEEKAKQVLNAQIAIWQKAQDDIALLANEMGQIITQKEALDNTIMRLLESKGALDV